MCVESPGGSHGQQGLCECVQILQLNFDCPTFEVFGITCITLLLDVGGVYTTETSQ